MWTRAELKAKAKASMRANYWKTVAAGLLLFIALTGGVFLIGQNVRNAVTPLLDQLGLMGSRDEGTFACL